jgi:hypothetical protein
MRPREGLRFQSAMRFAEARQCYGVCLAREWLHLRCDMLGGEGVTQISDSAGPPPLRFFGRWVRAEPDLGEHFGGSLARLVWRQLRHAAECHHLFADATPTGWRTIRDGPGLCSGRSNAAGEAFKIGVSGEVCFITRCEGVDVALRQL